MTFGSTAKVLGLVPGPAVTWTPYTSFPALTRMLARTKPLDGAPSSLVGISTTLYLRLPADRGFGFVLTTQRGVGLLDRLLPSQDVRVGDAIFDEAFVVRATEPAVTKAKLQDRSVTAAFLSLFEEAAELEMEDGALFVRWSTALDEMARVQRVLADARVIAAAFAPETKPLTARASGPYR